MVCKAALIVVDVQNDFCPPDGSLAISGGRDIVPLINRLLASPQFAVKVATQDYHPQDHISFASNHPSPNNKPFESFIELKNLVANKPEETMKQRLWPDHCVQGTKGCDLIDELDATKFDLIVKKGMDSRVEMYSAFSDCFGNLTAGSGGVNLDLADELQGRGISYVYVVGLAGDYCVRDTALGAAQAGFTTYVVEEGQRCGDPNSWNDVKEHLRNNSVSIVSALGSEVARVFNP